jgi:hypothetical protein
LGDDASPSPRTSNQNAVFQNGNAVEGMLNASQQPVLGFSLIHVGGGQSWVTLSNMNQFSDGTTKTV